MEDAIEVLKRQLALQKERLENWIKNLAHHNDEAEGLRSAIPKKRIEIEELKKAINVLAAVPK